MAHWKHVYSPMNGSNGKLDYHKRSLPKLSFGVELEFALATIPYRRTDPDPEDGRQVYGITQREDRALAKELPADRARRAQVLVPCESQTAMVSPESSISTDGS
jgi:hypothetical protein